ncbi:MAG: ATP-dependent zinc protease [Gammaproteobacteria bacterium]|nr:ATP-dependent zinc protease [Gammaproteobacteria bacterium]
MSNTKKIIGRIENVSLPDLAIENLKVKVDTGAKTSSLHVDNIKQVKGKGKPRVTFDLHPEIHDVNHVVSCSALLSDIRNVKSSNGKSETRYVIKTPLTLGSDTWEVEITLTNRADMNYLMLFGCEAMEDRYLVDVSQSFVQSE